MSIVKIKGKTVVSAAILFAAMTTGLLLICSSAQVASAQAASALVEADMTVRAAPTQAQMPADMTTQADTLRRLLTPLNPSQMPANTTTQADIVVPISLTDESGVGEEVGTVALSDTQYGLLLTPSLMGLPPGIHGFHVHQNPACGLGEKDGKVVPGLAAGGHYDPANTNSHEGPYGEGHVGDLPPLYVDMDGSASTPVLAPRLTVADVVGHSMMIHMDGDNFADMPAPLGGGGARLACGVIEAP